MSLKYFHYGESANFPLLVSVSSENNWLHLSYRNRGITANWNQWAQWLRVWGSEVGCLAQTGIYKHYLSHIIHLFLSYGILFGSLLIVHIVEQITTHQPHSLWPFRSRPCILNLKYSCWSALEIPSSFPLFFFSYIFFFLVRAWSHFKDLMHLRRIYLYIFICIRIYISNSMYIIIVFMNKPFAQLLRMCLCTSKLMMNSE